MSSIFTGATTADKFADCMTKEGTTWTATANYHNAPLCSADATPADCLNMNITMVATGRRRALRREEESSSSSILEKMLSSASGAGNFQKGSSFSQISTGQGAAGEKTSRASFGAPRDQGGKISTTSQSSSILLPSNDAGENAVRPGTGTTSATSTSLVELEEKSKIFEPLRPQNFRALTSASSRSAAVYFLSTTLPVTTQAEANSTAAAATTGCTAFAAKTNKITTDLAAILKNNLGVVITTPDASISAQLDASGQDVSILASAASDVVYSTLNFDYSGSSATTTTTAGSGGPSSDSAASSDGGTTAIIVILSSCVIALILLCSFVSFYKRLQVDHAEEASKSDLKRQMDLHDVKMKGKNLDGKQVCKMHKDLHFRNSNVSLGSGHSSSAAHHAFTRTRSMPSSMLTGADGGWLPLGSRYYDRSFMQLHEHEEALKVPKAKKEQVPLSSAMKDAIKAGL
ncbi:unnamed protein product [Amoebophrya sp. A25]|nr:unnamed protein product [Amoebophrya sp. A25]|eukprot:GSA25T00001356001.1